MRLIAKGMPLSYEQFNLRNNSSAEPVLVCCLEELVNLEQASGLARV